MAQTSSVEAGVGRRKPTGGAIRRWEEEAAIGRGVGRRQEKEASFGGGGGRHREAVVGVGRRWSASGGGGRRREAAAMLRCGVGTQGREKRESD
jgi:hypothetical protein